MTDKQQKLLEDKVRQIVKEELMTESKFSPEGYKNLDDASTLLSRGIRALSRSGSDAELLRELRKMRARLDEILTMMQE